MSDTVTLIPLVTKLIRTAKEIIEEFLADKGYDSKENRDFLSRMNIKPLIHYRKNNKNVWKNTFIDTSGRWVVERTFAWLSNYRRIAQRWEIIGKNFLGFVHLAAAMFCFRRLEKMGLI